MLYKAILFEIDKMCPKKRFKVSCNRPPWLTLELIEIGKERDVAFVLDMHEDAKKRRLSPVQGFLGMITTVEYAMLNVSTSWVNLRKIKITKKASGQV